VKIPPPPIPFEPAQFVTERPWGREYRAEFPSARPSGVEENDRVPLRLFLPREGNRFPVVLILHYLGAGDLRVERMLAEELAKRGIASAALALPYHLERTPPGRVSGELAILPDVPALRANLLQSISDVRRAVDFLQQRPEFAGQPVGLAGVSLGALVSSLAYGVDDRLERAAFVLGGADLAQVLWRSSRVVAQRNVLRSQGFTEEKLREEMADVEPLTYLTPKGNTLVVQAKHDTVIPTASSELLIRALGDPAVIRLDAGHYGGVFVQRRILREVAAFLASTFTGDAYTPPSRILAPTVRIGVILTPSSGPDLGVGIDLFRLDPQGRSYGSVFATPRGLQGVIGTKLDRNLGIGVTIGSRGFSPGLFWSTVL
jgi:dienelactone hydrolase